MNAEQFIEEYKKLEYSKDELMSFGASEKSYKQYSDAFKVTVVNDVVMYSDPIIDLISRYDLEYVEIGMVTFKKQIIEVAEYYIIGNYEIEEIGISKLNGEIVNVDESREFSTMSIAKDSESFLKSLLFAVKFFNNREKYPTLLQDEEFAEIMVNECAEIAGGSKYLEFYQFLFGIY